MNGQCRAGDTNGNQFFIIYRETTPWLDGKYNVFSEVINCLDIIDHIALLSRPGDSR
ncbi:MAG: peptidylprolyl isomerase [Flavobacteriales bacterium]